MNRIRINKGALLGGLTAIGLAAASMGSIPTANATCASFFGINNGGGCTSSLFSVAIAIGTGATAEAGGFLGASYSFGNGATATSAGALDLAVAAGPDSWAKIAGNLNVALAGGTAGGQNYAEAEAGYGPSDFANLAVSLANDSYAFAGAITKAQLGAGNIGINLGQGNDVEAAGLLNLATGIGGKKGYVNNGVFATGTLNNASSFGGDLNTVNAGTSASSVGNLAFNFLGNSNNVTAGPGPLAIAGSLLQTGATVTKVKPGFNINGIRVPNTAASVTVVKPSAATQPTSARATAGGKRGTES